VTLVRRLVGNYALRDAAWAALVLVIGIGDLAANPHSKTFPGSVAANLAFLVGSAVPLAFRRYWPASVAVVVISGVTLWDVALYPPQNQASFEAFLMMLAASYILGADPRGRRQLWTTALVAGVILPGWLTSVGFGSSPGDALPALVFTILAWVVGYTLRRRKEQAAIERARADGLAFERGRVAAEAAIDERSRIARELHDVVAHSLSVMVVQASAERRARAVGNADAETTNAVLSSVENTGRDALVELRRLLGLIRRTDEAPSRQPQPTLRALEPVVEQVVASGVQVEVDRRGDLDQLPPGVDLAAFRVVQESLTNVVKHASASTALVRIGWVGGSLDIEVLDDGVGGCAALPAGGHGLTGMRERVAMYGGSLEAGLRDPGPGFRVHVSLPVTRTSAAGR
jgi:signal transduction histidine kinase